MSRRHRSLAHRAAIGLVATALSLTGPLAVAAAPDDLDFWLGQWNLTWGSDGTATNTIARGLDGNVIIEQFDARPGDKLVGMSVSVYDKRADTWKQTWVDNTGSYLDFTGGPNPDGTFEMFRGAKDADGNAILQRMLWYNIRAGSLDWNWERSTDGGQSWETVWKIHYERAAPAR